MEKLDRQHPKMDTFLNYKGIRIFANEGLHEECFAQIEKMHLDKDTPILILGAGGGAFDQRLLDHGYKNITAVDLFPEDYKAQNKNIIKRDLQEDFGDIGKFKLIIAMEVIEHLENPFHFIRNVEKNLAKDGILLLSTPSIESKYYRVLFLLKGEMNYFSQYALENGGHITPIFKHLLEYNLELSGLQILKTSTSRNSTPGKSRHPNTLRGLIGKWIYSFIYSFISGDEHDLSIYIIGRKS